MTCDKGLDDVGVANSWIAAYFIHREVPPSLPFAKGEMLRAESCSNLRADCVSISGNCESSRFWPSLTRSTPRFAKGRLGGISRRLVHEVTRKHAMTKKRVFVTLHPSPLTPHANPSPPHSNPSHPHSNPHRQSGFRFSKNAATPSCASASMKLQLMVADASA